MSPRLLDFEILVNFPRWALILELLRASRVPGPGLGAENKTDSVLAFMDSPSHGADRLEVTSY